MYQKKNQRNEHRLNFVRAYYNSFADDLTHFSGHQIAFANKAIQNFDATNTASMPVFEQGIYEMLGGLRTNEKKIQDIKKQFEKTIFETMNKGLTKHAEFYALIDKCAKGFEQYSDLTDKASKEYESYVQAFNSSMIEGKPKKGEKDVFTEAHKYSISVRNMVLLLVQINDDLVKMRPLAIAKELEYVKNFAQSFKDFALFTQENFGSFMSATLTKSKFIFDVVDSDDQINENFTVETEYHAGNVLLAEDLDALNASREMINQDVKVDYG